MIKTYSQRMSPPYYGQVQIAESERARALTVDGQLWEIQFLHSGNGGLTNAGHGDHGIRHQYRRAVTVSDSDIRDKKIESILEGQKTDERILELTDFLADITLPFPAADHYEYWLLDAQDQSPLALIFSCKDQEKMNAYPTHPEWTALPSAVMPIDMTDEEKSYCSAPVNYRFERLVAERAGNNPKARWFTRGISEDQSFPPFLVREDWPEQDSADLCVRYLQRQSPRLLMLHGLDRELRKQLEINARSHALEVDRFFRLYPEIIDQALMDTIRVEAKLRSVMEDQPALHTRRDGVHYL
jgi:hypothetical protein